MTTVNEIKIAVLKRELQAGIDDLERGRFYTYIGTNILRLADDISRSGKTRLTTLRLTVTAKGTWEEKIE